MNSILYLFNSITGAGCIQSYTWSSLYSILYLELIVFYSIHGAGIVFWSWLYKIRYLEMVVFKPLPGAGSRLLKPLGFQFQDLISSFSKFKTLIYTINFRIPIIHQNIKYCPFNFLHWYLVTHKDVMKRFRDIHQLFNVHNSYEIENLSSMIFKVLFLYYF